jgi:hypothetical protein
MYHAMMSTSHSTLETVESHTSLQALRVERKVYKPSIAASTKKRRTLEDTKAERYWSNGGREAASPN